MQDEPVVIRPAAGPALEGRYHPGPPVEQGPPPVTAVIAPPHPLHGGHLGSHVVVEVARTCAAMGLATLRFNWRGVGESEGQRSEDLDDARADYAAALAWVEERGGGDVIACGYSFGAGGAVRATLGSRRVRGWILVAPPPPLAPHDAICALTGPVLVVAAQHDAFAPLADVEGLASDVECRQVEVIRGADHFFATGHELVGDVVGAWLRGAG